ncbi:MAG: nucleotide-binding protein [Xenococcus sp. MO_188.B8]|nr:nucleotide-binding protein [Xenococcus sp. MO_188.B8]
MPNKPSIFIGSSKEGLKVARAIEINLHDDAIITLWRNEAWDLGISTLEYLLDIVNKFDFAILVLSADDVKVETKAIHHHETMFYLNLVYSWGNWVGNEHSLSLKKTSKFHRI